MSYNNWLVYTLKPGFKEMEYLLPVVHLKLKKNDIFAFL